eukprot:gene14894-20030_t
MSSGSLPASVNFTTAGLGGLIGWTIIHPFNTLSIRMNLIKSSNSNGVANNISFYSYLKETIRNEGILTLYSGLSAGLLRQIFYSTSRFGFFEVFRDEIAKHRPVDFLSRLLAGIVSGGLAAVISCPAEVTLVRISNDSTLPIASRRNYKGVINAFYRILKEEGPKTFFSGCGPFVNRAMLVGAVQVGTYDQFKSIFCGWGVKNELLNVFYASMTSGLIYSIITMPLETAKNRMAFQKVSIDGIKPYRSTLQTISTVMRNDGVLALWAGFPPYYIRCGGHTVFMFLSVEWLRKQYKSYFIS